MMAPLTPADCDLRDFPFMPMDIVRLFGSEFHALASDSGWRAGVTLWLKSFHQVPAASLPNDDIQLARLAELGRDVKSWKKLRGESLRGWIECDDGRLYHPVVAEKALEAWRRKEVQRERSRRGNEARWGGKDRAADESGSGQAVKTARRVVAQAVRQGSESRSTEEHEASLKDSFRDSSGESFKDRKGQGQGYRERNTPPYPPGGSA